MVLERLLSNLAVHVEPFALCQVSTGWRLHLPGPSDVMFHFVLEGRAVVRAPDGADCRLDTFWLAVVPAGLAHSLEWEGAVKHEHRVTGPPGGEPVFRIVAGTEDHPDLVVACGSVKVRYGQSLGLFDHLRDVLPVDLSGIPQVRNVFEGILTEQSRPDPGSGALTAALMTQCLVHMFRRLGALGDCPLPWLTALDDPRLARVVDRILQEPEGRHTVESLAETASMSRSAFAERFSTAFGRTPMGLLHHVRMQHAARLLRLGEALSIDEVASRVGFSSRSHFSQAFKKHCGISPATYRAAH